jgi:hypothetical protein
MPCRPREWQSDSRPSPFGFRVREAPKMFTRYARHFENIWNNAEDWHP